MKTYLSRLLARAVPSPMPLVAPRPDASVLDNPFEQTAPPLAAPASVTPAPAHPSPRATPSTTPSPAPLQPLPPSAKPSRASTRGARAKPAIEETPSATPRLDPPIVEKELRPSRASTPPPPAENPPIEKRPRKRAERAQHLEPKPAPLTPLIREKTTASPAPAAPNADAKLAPPAPTPATPASSAPSAADDAVRLQHMADSFMAQFSRRAEALLAPGLPPSESPAPSVAPVSPATSSPQKLAPTVSATPPVAPPPPPSVVIGRVSIEVVPPATAPAPVPAARATPRRATSRAIPAPRSSARFGLGQL